MNFESISLLLNWMEMGVLLAILFRLSNTFQLIANTQRELRRAIHQLGEHRVVVWDVKNSSGASASASVHRPRRVPANTESVIGRDDLASLSP